MQHVNQARYSGGGVTDMTPGDAKWCSSEALLTLLLLRLTEGLEEALADMTPGDAKMVFLIPQLAYACPAGKVCVCACVRVCVCARVGVCGCVAVCVCCVSVFVCLWVFLFLSVHPMCVCVCARAQVAVGSPVTEARFRGRPLSAGATRDPMQRSTVCREPVDREGGDNGIARLGAALTRRSPWHVETWAVHRRRFITLADANVRRSRAFLGWLVSGCFVPNRTPSEQSENSAPAASPSCNVPLIAPVLATLGRCYPPGRFCQL
jgi:hypothetical protein